MDTKTTTRHRPELREGDGGLGIPRARVEGARVLNDEEIEEARRLEDEELRRQFEKSLRQLDAAKASFELPAGVRRGLTWGGYVLASVLGLFLVSQVAGVVGDIRTLPEPFDRIVGALALFFAATLSWLILRLVLMLVRLQRNPSVNQHAIQTLQERRHMQDLAAEYAEKAKRELRNYLENYQLDDDARKRLIIIELTESECDDLAEAKRFLLASDEPMPPDEWLSEFRSRFQSILDRVAESRAKKYAMEVGVGTALFPAMIDKVLVLYYCMVLIRELMFLYGLRPAFGQTATVLVRSILLQISLGDLIQETAKAFWSEVGEHLGVGEATAAGISAFVPNVGAKITEGAVNGFLIWRLGKNTISFLQPIRPAN